jgi:hypothetical protein
MDESADVEIRETDGLASAMASQTGGAHKVKISSPYMTKYERARVLGVRALQIRYAQAMV